MLKKLISSALFLSSLVALSPLAKATDIVNAGGGILAHIVSGGEWTTIITLTDLSVVSAPYTVHFYGNDGQPQNVSTSLGTGSTVSGTLNSLGSVIIQTTGDPNSPVQQGWAWVETSSFIPIAGSAVFRLTLPNSPQFEASVPLTTGVPHQQWGIPADLLNANTGLAISNSFSPTTANVTVNFYDLNGNPTFSASFQLPGLGHDSFMLPDRFPQLAGQQGTLFVSADQFINVLGLRTNGRNFSSITPMLLFNW